MKRSFIILSTLLLSLAVVAQDFDKMLITDQDIQGTARYVSMGGAFAALGGDVSAVVDNPAALGVFRRAEFSFTMDGIVGNNPQESNRIYTPNTISLPQIAGVLSWGKPYKQKGLLYNNFIVQFHRLKDYSQHTQVAGSASSQTHWMATAANQQGIGIRDDVYSEEAWGNENISWLSVMGAQGGLINYDDSISHQWHSIATRSVDASLEVREAGSLDQYSIGWGCNISNQVYIGLTANMRTLSYEKISYYHESLNQTEYNLTTTFVSSGMGFNAAAGVIYRPIEWLRLGASFQSPTWMNLRMRNYADMTVQGMSQDIGSPENITDSYGYTYMLPMRAVGGVAFQIKNMGLVSLEYDYTHQPDKTIPDTHWLRIGNEWIVKNNLFLRVGYAYKSSFSKEDGVLRWSYNTVRTDTDFRAIAGTHYASAGIGYRNKRWIIDAAYQYKLASMNQYMLEDGAPFALTDQTHRIVISLGWNRR